MKAIVKETGKVVNIGTDCLAGFLADDGSYYEDDELSTELDDWSAFRRETAKDILAGFAAKIGHPIDDYPEQSCKYAIKLADELIKQLKGEEK